ncbi:MAG: alpha/beta hydrolase [Gammaproteobacteria bacterium]|nr:MAG: alpha/beta hydrolase [Gammaproteobacteria bacterium]
MRILKGIIFVYICIGAFLYFFQRSFIYSPTPAIDHPYTEVAYRFDNANVRVIILNKGNKKAILYFGGNGEAVEYNAPAFKKLFKNHTIYLVKYRGYGGSTGEPSEKNLYSDALNIFDDIKRKHTEITVIGRSLGSGISTYVSSKRNIKNLVLVTPYDSIESIAQEKYPIYPMFILLKDKYNSIGRANLIKANTLLLVAENDQTIKKSHSIKLANAFKKITPKVVVITNAGHNTISNSRKYNEVLSKFVNTGSI